MAQPGEPLAPEAPQTPEPMAAAPAAQPLAAAAPAPEPNPENTITTFQQAPEPASPTGGPTKDKTSLQMPPI